MFKNKTAWFSISVRTDISTFWVSHGGGISSWRAADYLFSDDASCPDTERIHTSEDYAMDRATVFHSAYLTTCKLRGSARSVPLGHYLLPPLSIQREIKSMIGRFIWEQNELSREAVSILLYIHFHYFYLVYFMFLDFYLKCSGCCEVQLYPVNNMDSGYVHIDQLKKYSGELHDFFPTCLGCSISTSHSRRHPYQHNER
uniref:Uncharacterized protein n=1 Tax=Electrophorus electricus TaxID=8005 RepID=A0A4W4GSA5_ELEEL